MGRKRSREEIERRKAAQVLPEYLDRARKAAEWFTPERTRLAKRMLAIDGKMPGTSDEVRSYFETVCRRLWKQFPATQRGVIELTEEQAAECVAQARDLFIWAAISSRGKPEPNRPPRKQKKSAVDLLDIALLNLADNCKDLGFDDEKALVTELTATREGRERWGVTRYEGKQDVANLARNNLLRRIRECRSKLPK